MSENISKHTKFIVNLPYSKPRIERSNVEYANIFLQDYSGVVSEFTAISLYVYQHVEAKENLKIMLK